MTRPILKTKEEIELMRVPGQIVANCLKAIDQMVAPGVTTAELDAVAEKIIRDAGAIPAFLDYPSGSIGVKPYPATICASINEEVVHGIPSDRQLDSGDIISVDVGAEINGFFGDAAFTYPVGDVSKEVKRLLKNGQDCLKLAINNMKAGATLKDIASAIQNRAQKNGYSVVKQFVGHGIGRQMHEPPQVPNYVQRGLEAIKLPVGTVLAIEPMVNMGRSDVVVMPDGWTVVTRDRKPSVHFEHSIAITEDGPVILTEF